MSVTMYNYFTLEAKYEEDPEHWYPQFGDYERSVVKEEMDNIKEQGQDMTGIKEMRITVSKVTEAQYLYETE